MKALVKVRLYLWAFLSNLYPAFLRIVYKMPLGGQFALRTKRI